MTEMTRGELIADELRRALKGDPWHGPSLHEILRGISAEEAMQRPVPTGHSIWELVLHITTWSNIALRRITSGQVEPDEGEDWPVPSGFSEDHWSAIRDKMTGSHERLCEVVAGLGDDRLMENAPKSSNSVAVMLHGVAQHDAYHGGQISLLKKLVTKHHRRTAL